MFKNWAEAVKANVEAGNYEVADDMLSNLPGEIYQFMQQTARENSEVEKRRLEERETKKRT